jgi:hypothetical protein
VRDRLAVWLCNLILNTVATGWYRDTLDRVIRTSVAVVDLHTSIECVLLDHANARPLAEPVPCKGALGLWWLPDDVDAQVRAQLDLAGAG